MNYLSIFLYILSLSLSFITLYISFKMYRRYVLRYLAIYLYFLISFNVLGFLNLTGRYLVINILSDLPKQTIMHVVYLFAFLIFPLAVLSIYLFFYLMRSLLDKEVSATFNKFYFVFWATVFLAQVLLMKNYYDTNEDRLLSSFLQGVNISGIISFCFIPLYLLFNIKKLIDKNKKKAFRNFGLIYLLCFAFTFIITSKFILPYFGSLGVLLIVSLFFILNLPSLLYLNRYLNKYYIELQPQLETEADLEDFFSEHEISTREKEIILLMLKGNSNRDIESELFISLHTVKNHIYNIYQKLGVKNRLQINNLIRKHLQNKSK